MRRGRMAVCATITCPNWVDMNTSQDRNPLDPVAPSTTDQTCGVSSSRFQGRTFPYPAPFVSPGEKQTDRKLTFTPESGVQKAMGECVREAVRIPATLGAECWSDTAALSTEIHPCSRLKGATYSQ
jgi:hypothetical protein